MDLAASLITLLTAAFCLAQTALAGEHWPQPAGPHGNWQVEGDAPTRWSATRGENIRWRTTLPEAGMSSVTVWGDRVFVTTHVPIKKVKEKARVKDILGFCLDAGTGKILWQVELPGSAFISLAGGFTDGTVFGPITDGSHVWFFNRCGSMACYDFDGNQIWNREWTPRFKHNNRQAEPFLLGDTLLYVEVANKEAGATMQKWAAPGKKAKGGIKVPEGVEPKQVWTYIHGIDKHTGKTQWHEQVGTVVHNTPVIGRTAAGTFAIAHARGGPHGPLEQPAGHSLTSLAPGEAGKTLWSTEIAGYDPSFACHWNEQHVFGFRGMNHVVMDAATGKILREQAVDQASTLWTFDAAKSDWNKDTSGGVKSGRRHPNTNQANLLIGDWHWFLVHDFPYVGRIHTESGAVEYLELPAQLLPDAGQRSKDVRLWGKAHPENLPLNTRGFAVGDKGHKGTGFGHISAASPIRVGPYLFLALVTGTVHVIDTRPEHLTPTSLIAVNDLGPGGKTWSLASLSFADGCLYAHTMREILCIEPN